MDRKFKKRVGILAAFVGIHAKVQATAYDVIYSPLFVGVASAQKLKKGLGAVMGIIATFGFLMCVNKLYAAANHRNDGDTDAMKSSLMSAAMYAAAPILVGVIFGFFGMKGAVVELDFNSFN